MGPNLRDQLEAFPAGRRIPAIVQIHQQQIEGALAQPFEHRVGGADELGFVALAGEEPAEGLEHVGLAGHDVAALRSRAAAAVGAARGGRPVVIEFDTVRLGPHSKGDDTRTPEELEALRAQDWHPRWRLADPERFQRLEDAVRRRLERLFEAVERRPPSRWDGA